jgi:hypothetical protein
VVALLTAKVGDSCSDKVLDCTKNSSRDSEMRGTSHVKILNHQYHQTENEMRFKMSLLPHRLIDDRAR